MSTGATPICFLREKRHAVVIICYHFDTHMVFLLFSQKADLIIRLNHERQMVLLNFALRRVT